MTPVAAAGAAVLRGALEVAERDDSHEVAERIRAALEALGACPDCEGSGQVGGGWWIGPCEACGGTGDGT